MPHRLRRPLGDILRERSDARRAALHEQIQETFKALRDHGVVCEVIGSFARANALVDAGSDLDILVESKGDLSEADVWRLTWSHLHDVEADLAFAEHLPPGRPALMKQARESQDAFQALLLLEATDLEIAMGAVMDADAKQQQLKAAHPTFYDETIHAAGIAQHLGGIAAQMERLLNQAIELTDGPLVMCATRNDDLICLASAPSDDRVALIDPTGARCLKSVLGRRNGAASNDMFGPEGARVLERISDTAIAAASVVAGIRRLLTHAPRSAV